MSKRTWKGPDDDQRNGQNVYLDIPVATVSSNSDGGDFSSVVQAEYVSRLETPTRSVRVFSYYESRSYEEIAPALRGMFFGAAGMGFSAYMLHQGICALLSAVTPEMIAVTALFSALAIASLIVFAVSTAGVAPKMVRVRCSAHSDIFRAVEDYDTLTDDLVEQLK